MGRSTAGANCDICSHEYVVDRYSIKNIGLPWHKLWIAECPLCSEFNVVHDDKVELNNYHFETKYSNELQEFVTLVKSKDLGSSEEVKNKIKNNKISEMFVQVYVKDNPDVFGLEQLKGPFSTGPDFKGVWNGKEVDIEVEKVYTNYKNHRHHLD